MARSITFPLALLLLSALTVAGIAAAFLLGFRQDAWVVLPVVGVLAVWFLLVYSRRPGPLPARPTPELDDSEPFDDPVELAALVDAEAPRLPEAETPEGSDPSARPEAIEGADAPDPHDLGSDPSNRSGN